jgi:hypothetical protein
MMAEGQTWASLLMFCISTPRNWQGLGAEPPLCRFSTAGSFQPMLRLMPIVLQLSAPLLLRSKKRREGSGTSGPFAFLAITT